MFEMETTKMNTEHQEKECLLNVYLTQEICILVIFGFSIHLPLRWHGNED